MASGVNLAAKAQDLVGQTLHSVIAVHQAAGQRYAGRGNSAPSFGALRSIHALNKICVAQKNTPKAGSTSSLRGAVQTWFFAGRL
jgi:hypothetical protein